MTDRELERRLEQALSHTAPDDLEGVLSRCETRKGTVIPMKKKMTGRTMRNLIAACLALALVGGGGGLVYQQAYAVASVVSLDVNPSIEMTVNRSEKVLSCTPLNQEAIDILADMGGGADLKNTKLDVAVNAIVGALVRHGYLDSISSAILISVEDKDADRAAKLRQDLTAAVDSVLQEQSANASVLSQTLVQDAQLETQAKQNNISTGKAYLVRQVMEMNGTIATNSTTALDQLSALSVEELNDLLETRETRIPIGKSAAAQAAEAYAGTLKADQITTDVDPELDEVPAHYEVDLFHPTLGKFEYQVDAFTGKVLSGRANILEPAQGGTSGGSGNTGTSSGTSATDIGADKAKATALSHAGLKESQVTGMLVKRDYDDGRLEYEVEFWSGATEYDYTIDAATGAVLDYDVERHGSQSSGSGTSGTATDIGMEKAKSTALSHAGVSASAATFTQTEREYDDGRLEYELDFYTSDGAYEYTIDGATGAVLDYSVEHHSSQSSGSGTGGTTTDIGRDKAKAAALSHAGLSESQVTGMKVEADYDDGRLEYEVEFRAGNMEYEYTIDGVTAAVLEHESDWDD